MKRKPWVAVLLSILMPGLGQVYNGQAAKGLAFYASILGAGGIAAFWMLRVPGAIAGSLLPLAAAFLLWATIIADAYRAARRAGGRFEPKSYNRWYVHAGLALLSWTVVQPLWQSSVRRFIAQAFRIPGAAMAPTLLPGDYLLVDRRGFTGAAPSRGDLVVFAGPHEPGMIFLSRVVGVAGDTLRMQDKRLFVNGTALEEPYVQHVDPERDLFVDAMLWQRDHLAPGVDAEGYRPTRDDWGPLIVPDGHLFVLGDNRDDSEDSRYYGFVPESSVLGRPKRVYLSWDADARRARWGRIGQEVR